MNWNKLFFGSKWKRSKSFLPFTRARPSRFFESAWFFLIVSNRVVLVAFFDIRLPRWVFWFAWINTDINFNVFKLHRFSIGMRRFETRFYSKLNKPEIVRLLLILLNLCIIMTIKIGLAMQRVVNTFTCKLSWATAFFKIILSFNNRLPPEWTCYE